MDEANYQQGSAPFPLDQPNHVSQGDVSSIHWSNKNIDQITTELHGQFGHSLAVPIPPHLQNATNGQHVSRPLIDNALQINDLVPPLPPTLQSNCVENFLNHTPLEQSLGAVVYTDHQHTSNDQEAFLSFVDNALQPDELSALLQQPPQPSYLEDFLIHTLSGQSASAPAYSLYQQTPLAALNNTLQPSSSPHSNSLSNSSNHTLLEQSPGAIVDTDHQHTSNDQEAFPVLVGDVLQTNGLERRPPQPSYFSDFTLSGQSAGAYSQFSYPVNQHTPLTDLDNALQVSPSAYSNNFGNSSNYTLLEQSAGAQAFDQQSQVALDDQLNILSAQQQSGYLDDVFDQQSYPALLNQLQGNTFLQSGYPTFEDQSLAILPALQGNTFLPIQPQPGSLDHIFNNPSHTSLDFQGNTFLPQTQLQYLMDISDHKFDDDESLDRIFNNQVLAILPAPDPTFNQSHTGLDNHLSKAIFSGQPSTSIVIPLTRASLEYHNTSTAEVIQTMSKSRVGPCIACHLKKTKCDKQTSGPGEPRCWLCVKKRIPLQVCKQWQFKNYKIFDKWLDKIYERQFTLVQSSDLSSKRTAELKHFPGGPFLLVDCCRFNPAAHYQVRALRKNSSGWHTAETTAFCLLDAKMDLSSYVRECTEKCIYEARRRRDIVSPFFEIAYAYIKEPVIWKCFQLYTALYLIMTGCKFSGTRKERNGIEDDYLDMTRVGDRASAWFGHIPVPRMVTNQINHGFELIMTKLDSQIMEELEDLLESNNRHKLQRWVVTTLAVFLVEHVREIDIARIIFWRRYHDTLGFWIHPLKPQTLIEEATVSSSALLTAYHYTTGRKPLEMNWDLDESKAMVNNDDDFIKSVKHLQTYVSTLARAGKIGRKACDVYQDGNPKSAEFTVTSLIFAGMAEGCEVKGLY